MRIVCANVFCLNPTPRRALEAVAAQQGDVVVLIEAVSRFGPHADRLLPPRRVVGRTRKLGMPVAVHARESLPATPGGSGPGWVECVVAGVRLLAVHASAPYLPWRLRTRRAQLAALGARMRSIGEHTPALAIGDFNTAHFERRWKQATAGWSWRQLAPAAPQRRGTWPLGGVWAPIALDHALAPSLLHGQGVAQGAALRTFAAPGSDHRGLVVDIPHTVGGLPPPPPSEALREIAPAQARKSRRRAGPVRKSA